MNKKMVQKSEGPKLIGQFNGINVYYDEYRSDDSVGIVFSPIDKDPNEGRQIYMPFVCASTVTVEDNFKSALSSKLIESKYVVGVDTANGKEYSKTSVIPKDPTKPYYADTGEPWIPFKSKYKVGFIITKYEKIEEFKELLGDKVMERINYRLDIYNGTKES